MKKICIIVMLIQILLTGCTFNTVDIDGKWYCEELQLYFSLGEEDPLAICYLDYDHAEYIICGKRLHGQSLEITCNELNNARYKQLHRFLDGKVISVKDDSFVVKDSGKKYTFKKVDGVPIIDTTITTEHTDRLTQAGISVMQEGFLSDHPIPELDYDAFTEFIRGETSIEQVKALTDIQYVKQKENHFYTTVSVVRDGQKQLTYIDFGWDLTFDHNWEIQYSQSVNKADMDAIVVGTNREEIMKIDLQGDYSVFRFDKMRYNQLSYHAVQDEDGHGYGYWILYDGHTPDYKVMGIYQIDTY